MRKKIMAMAEELDGLYFRFCKKVLISGVKKSKYKKNKFQVLNRYRAVGLSFEALLIFGLYNFAIIQLQGFGPLVVLHSSMWLGISFLRFRQLKALSRFEKRYSFFFERRKDPDIYKMVKEENRRLWERTREARIRTTITETLAYLSILSLMGVFFSIVTQPLLPASFLGYFITDLVLRQLEAYAVFVFDFENPDKKDKKKKAKDSLTDIVKNRIKNLTRSMDPQGSGAA